MTKKQKVQFDAKVTPEQVKEKLKEKEKNLADKEKRIEEIKELSKPAETEQPQEEKEKKPREVKPSRFPVDARINDYGFLHFKVGLLAALGWHKGMALKIDKKSDGSITVTEV